MLKKVFLCKNKKVLLLCERKRNLTSEKRMSMLKIKEAQEME